MLRARFSLLFLALTVLAAWATTNNFRGEASTSPTAQAAPPPTLAIATPLGGFTQPVVITHAGDGTGRIFVVEQTGRIRIVKNGVLLATPFLDLSTRISTGGERGLLGLAFPNAYASKGYFYVNYTNTAGHTVIARYRRNATNPDLADFNSEQIVLFIEQPFPNHNGGQLAFGPNDRLLYIGMGDGGSGGDPGNRAQNPNELLGKLLRIETETGKPTTYTVPPSNPFVGRAGFRPEIWALGLRNPWRFSFDRMVGDLFVADVGQGNWEEVNFQTAASRGAENYGWRIMEGAHCFDTTIICSTTGLTMPVAEYNHSLGCSVTGGYIYRGSKYPNMQGLYFYGDFCSGRIWSLGRDGTTWVNSLLIDTTLGISTFGEDEAGNLYVANYGAGTIAQVIDTTAPTVTVQFSATSYTVSEGANSVDVSVTRSGNTSTAGTVSYATVSGSASDASDFTASYGTLHFAAGETTKTFKVLITDDGFSEGAETVNLTLLNTTNGFALADTTPAQLTINDNDPAPAPVNPIEEAQFFVRRQYHDFLNREPDAEGLEFWTNNITSCGANAGCREVKRIDTSAAFFLAIEFQETGYLVYKLHQAAFASGERLQLGNFLRDTQEVSRGVIVNQTGWELLLEANTQAFLDEFVARPLFNAFYPSSMTPAQFVDALNANTGGSLSQSERDTLVAQLSTGARNRAQVLRAVAEDADFDAREKSRAFVLMQYFGYLRRNPNDPPQELQDYEGYNFWLSKLNSFGGDYRRAEMVKAFITSGEYRARFGL